MRIIKYRAWDLVGKRMLMFDKGFSWHDEYDLLYLDGDRLDVPVKDNIVFMQFTGLKDKNGIEIYEGDIVSCIKNHGNLNDVGNWTPATGIAVIESNGWSFYYKKIKESMEYMFYGPEGEEFMPREYNEETWEIIGNKYENPELLK